MKKIIYILFALYSLLFDICLSQPTQEWARRYNSPDNMNDNAIDMVLDKSGNIYITGWCATANEGNNIITIKYNSSGVLLWTASYNYSGTYSETPTGIAVDTSGNVYVAGYTQLSTGTVDWIVVKYNSNGVQQWSRFYANPLGGDDSPSSIAIDKTQNIYVVGDEGFYPQNNGALLIKYNPAGDSIKVKRYRPTPPQLPWGQYTGFNKVKIDANDNVYLGGSTYNTMTLNVDCFVFKFDSSGTQQWFTNYNSGGNRQDRLVDMVLDVNNNVYTTGTTSLGSPIDYLTLKFNANGSLAWASVYNGTAGGRDYASAIVVDKNGNNVYVTGKSHGLPSTTDYDYLTIKYNTANGDSVWVRRYNGGGSGNLQIDEAYSIAIDSLSNTYITGRSINNAGVFDFATLKYDSAGNQKWIARYLGIGKKVVVDNSLNVYVTGGNSEAGTGSDYLTIKYSQPVGIINYSNEVPTSYKLYQNFPNPFNPTTIIYFSIPVRTNVKMCIYDVLGKEVELLINEYLNSGNYDIKWDASGYTSGIYFYKITTESYTETRKMILIK